jgi:multisubunit Na+/H+ antiporter MnhB subunit
MSGSPVALAARVLFAPVLVVAAALLVKGYADGGGGFAAGVVAALGYLLRYVALGRPAERRMRWPAAAPRLALGGLAVMAACLLLPVFAGRPPAWHLPRPGTEVLSWGLVELHTALLFEAGVAVATFGFVAAAVHSLAEAGGGEGER